MTQTKMKFKYPIEIFWSDENEGYITIVPDLPACSAWGATEEKSINEAHLAAKAWMEAASSAGRQIPEPSIVANYSGKFLFF